MRNICLYIYIWSDNKYVVFLCFSMLWQVPTQLKDVYVLAICGRFVIFVQVHFKFVKF